MLADVAEHPYDHKRAGTSVELIEEAFTAVTVVRSGTFALATQPGGGSPGPVRCSSIRFPL
jgi:hypothetical protein